MKEHAKLLIQNGFACDVLSEGWYSSDPGIRDWLARRESIVRELSLTFDRQQGLPAEVVSLMLDLNTQLRRLHDAGPAMAGDGFDKAYRPLLGYDEAVERFLQG